MFKSDRFCWIFFISCISLLLLTLLFWLLYETPTQRQVRQQREMDQRILNHIRDRLERQLIDDALRGK